MAQQMMGWRQRGAFEHQQKRPTFPTTSNKELGVIGNMTRKLAADELHVEEGERHSPAAPITQRSRQPTV